MYHANIVVHQFTVQLKQKGTYIKHLLKKQSENIPFVFLISFSVFATFVLLFIWHARMTVIQILGVIVISRMY